MNNNNIIYNIYFPKLFLYFRINPVAFSMGSINIYWYGIIIAIGFLLAYIYISKKSRDFDITNQELDKFVIISSVISILCARLYYVIFYPGDYYIKNINKIFCISEGGLAIYGAIIGGILSLYILSRIYQKNVLNILDLMSFGVIIGQAIGRWGNFVNQEAFGSNTDLLFGMSSENTNFQTVHPCFLYESLSCFIIFIILNIYHKINKNKKPGDLFYLYIFLYSLARIFIETLRTDSLIIPYTNIKISQILGVILVLVSGCKLKYFIKRSIKTQKWTR